MLSSAAVLDYSNFTQNPAVGIIEQVDASFFPELIKLEQDKKTHIYELRSEGPFLSSVTQSSSSLMTTKDKIEIIKKAQASMREDLEDLDPGIQKMISENFQNLIWK